MKRFKKPKQETIALTQRDIKAIKKEVTETAVGTSSLLYMVACKDEFGFGYDEIEKLGATEGEVKKALDTYLDRANKLREKERSGYIGDDFTKVINKLYPKVDTKDLYKFTPDLYKSGIHV